MSKKIPSQGSVYFLSNIKRNLLYKNIKILGRRVKWLVQDNLNISSDMLTTSQVVLNYISLSFKDENYMFCMTIGTFKRNKTLQALGEINADIWFLRIQAFKENVLGKLSIELEYLN